MSLRARLALATLAALLSAAVSAPLAASADTLDVSPPGANNWSCKPSAAHPYPVVLVHGTFEDMAKNWSVLSPQIASAGYCVFALDYGNNATGPIEDSAQQLADFVHAVLGATGARKVDLVGHSQGGMMPRYYLKYLGGGREVDELIGIAPSNHGTTTPLAALAGTVCVACDEQVAGSAFLTNLNAGGDLVPGPNYTVISTQYDEVVTPYTSQALAGPSTRVTNVVIQDACPLEVIDHDQSPNDPVVAQWVLNALGRQGPADPAFRPVCGA